MNPDERRALRREHVIITMQYLLAGWLGIVHALAALLVFAVLVSPKLLELLLAASQSYTGGQSMFAFFAAIGGPGYALWIGKDFISWSLPAVKRENALEAGARRLFGSASEIMLLVWLAVVVTAAGLFAALLSADARIAEQLVRALAAEDGWKTMLLSAALVVGPSIVLWMTASRRLVLRVDVRGLFGM
jgi:hypothetical protein